MLHPADEGQKPETAVQGLHLLSFSTVHLIFHVRTCTFVLHTYVYTCMQCLTHFILADVQGIFMYGYSDIYDHMYNTSVGGNPVPLS